MRVLKRGIGAIVIWIGVGAVFYLVLALADRVYAWFYGSGLLTSEEELKGYVGFAGFIAALVYLFWRRKPRVDAP